jgi:hypothetical protein
MRRLIGVIALVAVLAAVFLVLRNNRSTDAELANETSTTTTQFTDTTAADEPTTTTVTDTSPPTTSPTTTTTQPAGTAPLLSVTEIQFGENGFIAITNIGNVTADLEDYAVCNRPDYFQIPSIELEPLEVVWLAVGDGSALSGGAGIAKEVIPMNGALGALTRADGEVAFYSSSAFADPEAIITYVQWGSPAHGREETAVAAGIWEEGAFLDVPDDAFGIQSIVGTAGIPTSPDDWVAGIGG